jgi:thioesterase domain-containing protein
MRTIQPDGPYVLVGYSFGCRVATAMCLLLQTLRLDVRRLVLIDGPITGPVVDLGTRPDLFASYLAISHKTGQTHPAFWSS